MNKFYLSIVKIRKTYNTNLLFSNIKYNNYYNNFNINSIQDWYTLENIYNNRFKNNKVNNNSIKK